MTVLVGDVAALRACSRAVLVDFDGPLCHVFAGTPAGVVAGLVVSEIRGAGVDVPQDVAEEPDPLAVLRWAGGLGDSATTRSADDALIREELSAVASATVTQGAVTTVRALHGAGLSLAVVSNNSASAVRAFLARRELSRCFATVVGRPYCHPERMKPSPDSVLRALAELAVPAGVALLVGDSLTDLEAGRAAGVPVVLLANRPEKIGPFTVAGPDALITSMADLEPMSAT